MRIETLLKLTTSYEKYLRESKLIEGKPLMQASYYTQVVKNSKLGAFFETILTEYKLTYPLDAQSMGILLANTSNNLDEIVEIIDNRLVSVIHLPIFKYIDETTHSIDDEISIEEINNALDCNVRVYLYSMDKSALGKFRAKIFYEIDAAKGLLKLFRTWNNEWESFSLGQTKDKPKSYDKFIEDINDKYVITIKQSIK